MGYQFIHLEGYAKRGSRQRGVRSEPGKKGRPEVRKWSVREIAAEAMREPDACPHVEHPQPPRVLLGCSPMVAAEMAEKWASTAQDGRGHALRADGLAMAAGVVSLPSDQAHDWPQFRDATVQWLQEQYGPRLRSVVEHTDEMHPHLHFYAVPLEGERFEVLHPGRLAAAKKARQGAKKGAQNTEYKRAMQGWQDTFQNAVAAHFGLARLGPGKRRLTRAAWQAEQAQAKALARVQPVPELVITPEDVKKQVTKGGLLKQYESGEELAARLTGLVQERAKPLAIQAAREDFSSKQSSRLIKRVQELEGSDDAARADQAERLVQELRQQIKVAEYRATKSEELAKTYQEGRDAALDELETLRSQRGHGLSA
jgi:hypothetical protein